MNAKIVDFVLLVIGCYGVLDLNIFFGTKKTSQGFDP